MPNGYGRRLCWLTLTALLAALPARADDLTPFKIGISAPVVTIFPVWTAQAAGLDAKEGLKVESISMEGGSRGVQVLLSGEIQAMHVGLGPVVQANKQGADLRLVTSTANTIPITIFASPAIKTAQDLKGKTIGISTFGSETDVAVSIALQRLGLKRDDVTVSQIGGASQRFGALLAAASTPRRCLSRPSPRRSRRVLFRCSISPPPTRRGSLTASWSRTII